MKLSQYKPFIVDYLLIVFSILACFIIVSTATSEITSRYDQLKQKNISESRLQQVTQNYKVPFLILMSNEEISIAQLPLIEDGKIHVVYQLSSNKKPEIERVREESPREEDEKEEKGTKNDDGKRESTSSSVAASQSFFSFFASSSSSPSVSTTTTTSTSTTTTGNADALEHEQMRKGTSLGKSEWQQIASSRKYSVPASGSNFNHEEEVGTKTRGQEDVAEEEARRRKNEINRPRRSNNLTAEDDDDASVGSRGNHSNTHNSSRSSSSSDGSGTNNTETSNDAQPNGSGVLESSQKQRQQQQTLDVTSARSENSPTEQETSVPSLLNSTFPTAPLPAIVVTATVEKTEEDETNKNSDDGSSYEQEIAISEEEQEEATDGSVQFRDFDVHMALGYAFVADSIGRIHRFKLSGVEKRNSNEYLMENDYPNTIALASASSQTSSADDSTLDQSSSSSTSASPLSHLVMNTTLFNKKHSNARNASTGIDDNNIAHDDASGRGYSDVEVSNISTTTTDDDDANKHSASSVTHEQSGRHPTVSGLSTQTSQQQQQTASLHLEAESLSSNTPTSVALDNSLLKEQLESPWVGREEKPKIIWSRKQLNRLLSDVGGASQPHKNRPSASKLLQQGAFPNNSTGTQMLSDGAGSMKSVEGQQHVEGSVGASSKSANTQQPLDDSATAVRIHSDGLNQGEGGARFEMNKKESIAQQSRGGSTKVNHSSSNLHTELAVDWLNNLLFVLDKYRLFVVDFDGNNELVLINDFNPNNRPVNIKLDPINGFLFWIQMGKFHNTIYKLDLNLLSMPTSTSEHMMNSNVSKLGGSANSSRMVKNNNDDKHNLSELVPLVSHHYAHPIITNLPKHVKLFTIDHKHSRIYVPLSPPPLANSSDEDHREATSFEKNHNSARDETEVFAQDQEVDSVNVTHMNSTSSHNNSNYDYSPAVPYHITEVDQNCTDGVTSNHVTQILAFNLDGTDVGPLRSAQENGDITSMNNIQDITLDTEHNYLYLLINEGKDLFEEYKGQGDTSFHSAQHNLEGKIFLKLKHFDQLWNQPIDVSPRFNLRKFIHVLSTSFSSNRLIRDSPENVDSILIGRSRAELPLDGGSRVSRNTPYIILGITSLVVIGVYMIYTLLFQHYGRRSTTSGNSREGSIGGSFLAESQVDGVVNGHGFIGVGANTITKWIVNRSQNAGSTDNSTFNRSCGNQRSDSCYLESVNDPTNAIDEHYCTQPIINDFDLESNLAHLRNCPNNMLNMSNRLYIPVEVLNDEALASINRVAADDLKIDEHKSPLGEGHFGIVLQGKVLCRAIKKHGTSQNKLNLHPISINVARSDDSQTLEQVQQLEHPVASSSSSGHGSSSTSSEFITATSGCHDATTGDYLTPRSQCNSAMGDFALIDNANIPPALGSCSSYYNTTNQDELKFVDMNREHLETTMINVAIKKLKDNATTEEKRNFLHEAKLLASVDHPNIVQLIGICLDKGSTLIVMELMLGGDLTRYMCSEYESLAEDDLLSICLDIVEACCYLEIEKYIHRDLAARNCLVSSRKRRERVVKLADFGLARDIYKDDYYRKTKDSAMPIKWMAPECVNQNTATTMSDVWSFGVVMWEVMSYCREKPYASCEPCLVIPQLIEGFRLQRPENCKQEIYDLMLSCWRLEPEQRPKFRDCKYILQDIRRRLD